MSQKFYICSHCGNIIAFVKDKGVPVICCGEKMKEIIPGTTDAAVEKHVPVISQEGNIVTVSVGSVEHPMIPEHYIEWIEIISDNVSCLAFLKPGEAPVATFVSKNSKVVAREFCNLHGLWKA